MTDTQRKPDPIEYDESIVQRLPYGGDDRTTDARRWGGGFFDEGRRNPTPHLNSDSDANTPGQGGK